MADPISIVGTVGAVANIIDVVGKTISTIREVRNGWKEADLTFLSLAAQLTTLQAALTKIKEWVDDDLRNPHHQLVIDLDVSMSCYRILISKIDVLLSDLHQTTVETLDFSSKVKLVFESKNIDDIQKLIQRQTNALNLLLTAYNCKTISEQKVLLEKSSTRKVLRRVEIDSASLFVNRDTASLISQWTDNLSKLSAVFSVDRELFVSKVYERALRGSVKEALRRQQGDIKARMRSQAIDRSLGKDSRKLRRECKVLLLGCRESGKSEIVKQWKTLYQNGYTAEELTFHRPTIYNNVIDCAKALILAMEQFEIHPEQELNRAYCDFLMDYFVDPDPNKPLGTKVGDAISSIWQDPCVPKIMERSGEFYIMDSAPYFFDEVKRIASQDYVPQEADVLRARTKTSGIFETRFTTCLLNVHLFDVSGHTSERKKWIQCFENVKSIIFVVDLACYDQVLIGEPSQNKMMESLVLFESVVNSCWFMRTSVLLLLSNAVMFKRKLTRSPLENHFPDYSGGSDANRAARYILWRFNQVNRAHLDLYPHLIEITDRMNVKQVFAALQKTLLVSLLLDSGIL